LALLGFLLPIFGIGAKPAICALILYALLPIIRNTIVGLDNVPESSVEAARALGFTDLQRLHLVELPLAMPVIMAGIRTAAVISVGIATIAAFIGAGGLGDFIFAGLSLNNSALILLGAVPAAIMALMVDFVIGRGERYLLSRRKRKRSYKKYLIGFCILMLLFFGFFTAIPKQDTIVIASKNFTEQFILGEMMAQMVEAKTNLKVIRKFNLGTTAICQQAMLKGDIDIYPEYTGTAYLLVLKKSYHHINAEQLYNMVKKDYQTKYYIIWLQPFGFNNTQTVAVSKQFAKKWQLKTIEDLAHIKIPLIIGAPPEFLKRPDGFVGLQKRYDLNFAEIRSLDPDLMYQAIWQKQVNVIPAFSTDGWILAYHLRVLQDNKHLYPSYYAAPLIRAATLKQHPEIAKALQPLAGVINNKIMQKLNYEVNVEKQSPARVAHRFLIKLGLLS
jgi:osmoprotectant transport system permease protein